MHKLIRIYKGAYLAACGLEYTTTRLDGTPFTGNYEGYAYVAEGRIGIDNGRMDVVTLIISDTPTEDSAQYNAGRCHALRQQRRRQPKNVSSQYFYGWYNAWEDKKKGNI